MRLQDRYEGGAQMNWIQLSGTRLAPQANTIGSTMHVMVGTIERRNAGLYPTYVDSQLTLVVPEEVEIIRR